jgi:hypothetical protein
MPSNHCSNRQFTAAFIMNELNHAAANRKNAPRETHPIKRENLLGVLILTIIPHATYDLNRKLLVYFL